MKLEIRDFKAKSGRDSGLKVCAGGELPKITHGITGLKNPIGYTHLTDPERCSGTQEDELNAVYLLL